ncbi:MAG: PIN domain-containing protein [Chloroflexi bacterium]|nr:MAG: PIN domain-containing protein [Chloroflexota bacterium]
MRAVLDPNVLISAILAPTGVPAALLRHWLDGEFELVVSERLLTFAVRKSVHRLLPA